MSCVVCGTSENLIRDSKCAPCEAQWPTMPIPGSCQECGAPVDLRFTAICDDCIRESDRMDYADMIHDLGPIL